jgi:hypothetical protein
MRFANEDVITVRMALTSLLQTASVLAFCVWLLEWCRLMKHIDTALGHGRRDHGDVV